MKLKWFGHSCFSLTLNDGTVLVTDPFDDTVGYPLCTIRADAALVSHGHFDHNHVESLGGSPKGFDKPGAWTFGSAKITATPSFHDDQRGAKRGKNLLFAVEADGVKVVHLGDLGHLPDAAQLKAISGADVMLIPVGGTYTITSEQAVEVVGMARPRLAVAMHFANQYCHFPVTGPEAFLQALDGKNLPNEIDLSDLTGLPRAAVMAEPE